MAQAHIREYSISGRISFQTLHSAPQAFVTDGVVVRKRDLAHSWFVEYVSAASVHPDSTSKATYAFTLIVLELDAARPLLPPPAVPITSNQCEMGGQHIAT